MHSSTVSDIPADPGNPREPGCPVAPAWPGKPGAPVPPGRPPGPGKPVAPGPPGRPGFPRKIYSVLVIKVWIVCSFFYNMIILQRFSYKN